MAGMRFNHMELSFAPGTLTKAFRDDVDAFYCDVLGWESLDTEVVGQSCHLLRPDDGQFLLLAEGDDPISSPGYDHLGLLSGDASRGRRCARGLSTVPGEGRAAPNQGIRRSHRSDLQRARLLCEVPPSDLVRRPVHGMAGRVRAHPPLAVHLKERWLTSGEAQRFHPGKNTCSRRTVNKFIWMSRVAQLEFTSAG